MNAWNWDGVRLVNEFEKTIIVLAAQQNILGGDGVFLGIGLTGERFPAAICLLDVVRGDCSVRFCGCVEPDKSKPGESRSFGD